MMIAVGVVLLIIAVIGVIAIANIIDSRSKRERGELPARKKRIRGKREK